MFEPFRQQKSKEPLVYGSGLKGKLFPGWQPRNSRLSERQSSVEGSFSSAQRAIINMVIGNTLVIARLRLMSISSSIIV